MTVASPLDGAVVSTRRITVSGAAAPGALVNAAGTAVTATRNGLWSAVVMLKPGAHPITVTAATSAGLATTSITVRYNPPPTTPAANSTAPTETTAGFAAAKSTPP